MNRKTMIRLLADRLEIKKQTNKLNARVRRAGKNRPHHQACPLGGLWTGMDCDISGSPCWCGASEALDP